jgi:hypothetical protein
MRRAHQFHDVVLGRVVLRARQALAVDERRIKFEPCLWEADEDTRRDDEASGRVSQVWFEGAHSDVGGGYPDTGLSDTALLWMVTEANRQGLVFDTRLLSVYVDSGSSVVRHDSLTAFYRFLNLTSRLRTTRGRKGRRFLGSWRRLDPPPLADTGQRAVGVQIASSVSRHFLQDESYGGPNVVEYAEQTHSFTGRIADVVALPEATGAVSHWLAAQGVDLGAPPRR